MKNENEKKEKETIKEVREKANALVADGIANEEALKKALPVLIDLKDRVVLARKGLAASVAAMTMLSELCSKYVLKHESFFKAKKLITNQQGVRVGDIDLGDVTYHFANGYDGYERDDGGKLTQDFLSALPESWRKQKFEISTSGIDEAKATDKELAKRHLRQKVKNEWSLGKSNGSADEDL